MQLTDPVVSFIIVLTIGVVAGWLAEMVWRTSWLSKQMSGRGRVLMTSALVGIAGAFIGFHIAALLHLSGAIVPFIGAAAGAALILWGWRTIKF